MVNAEALFAYRLRKTRKMFPTAITGLIRQLHIRYRTQLCLRHRWLSLVVFTTIFALIFTLIQMIVWKVYLSFPHRPLQAWMDPREQAMIIRHLQAFNAVGKGAGSTKRSITMLEYGAGSSTFVFSMYTDRYVSIEHNINYCRLFERMAASQSDRSIVISYMQSHSFGFVEKYRYEQNSPTSIGTPSIHIYCILPDIHSLLLHRFWSTGGRSTYSMYKNYVDFVSVHLSDQFFDFVLIDGRARPQVAYVVLKQLNGEVFLHDWNRRPEYHVIARHFYDVVDQQIESDQLGGGGLVVLKRKVGVTGEAKLNEINWHNDERPRWWL